MRRSSLCALVFTLVVIFVTYSSGHYINNDASITNGKLEELIRAKRQVETFDTEDYPTTASEDSQDEPSFWDRVVKIAVKLFSRFIEWLNS